MMDFNWIRFKSKTATRTTTKRKILSHKICSFFPWFNLWNVNVKSSTNGVSLWKDINYDVVEHFPNISRKNVFHLIRNSIVHVNCVCVCSIWIVWYSSIFSVHKCIVENTQEIVFHFTRWLRMNLKIIQLKVTALFCLANKVWNCVGNRHSFDNILWNFQWKIDSNTVCLLSPLFFSFCMHFVVLRKW